MLQAATGRSILGPHAAIKYEAELRPLDKLGLSDVEMDAVLTLILTHVEGTARAQATRDHTQRDTGMTDEEWWVSRAPLLDKLIDPARFPVATRVGIAAGQEYQSASSPEFAFVFVRCHTEFCVSDFWSGLQAAPKIADTKLGMASENCVEASGLLHNPVAREGAFACLADCSVLIGAAVEIST